MCLHGPYEKWGKAAPCPTCTYTNSQDKPEYDMNKEIEAIEEWLIDHQEEVHRSATSPVLLSGTNITIPQEYEDL